MLAGRKNGLLIAALAITLGSLAASTRAEILYNVKVDGETLNVTMKIPAARGPVSVQIANWMPGSYVYGDFYQNVTDVAALDGNGSPITPTHPDNNTWTVESLGNGPVTFTYKVPARRQRRFAPGGDESFLQISGASTYMYVVGRKTEACKVTFDVPKGWPLMLSLDPDSRPNTFDAPSYDVLADAPVSTGPGLIIEHYTLRGKDHAIVIEGAARADVDKDKLLKDCRFVSAAETDFFGGAPYNRYVWHFIAYQAPDGAGGLEHLGSTQISLSTGLGPRAESVLAHEYFHLWNVKRTRAKVLGPFDYLTLPKTGALWWLEGVTDYYASLLPYRYKEWDRDQLFGNIVRNLDSVRSNAARLNVSPYAASYRVSEANNGRGNSQGYLISYYNLGWLCGLCLDIEIREKSGGKHSLDDVTRALFDICKNNQPGFDEDEIRKQCIRFGGPSLGDFYDKVVMSPGELPVEEQLSKVGLKLHEGNEGYVDLGFRGTPLREGHGIRPQGIHGPAENMLQADDVITAVDGTAVAADPRTALNEFTAISNLAKAGTPITFAVKRGDSTINVTVTPVAATRKVRNIVNDPAATKKEVELRDQWLIQKTPSVS
jgi:predicted metalloprotease with PDZ domain